MLFSTLGIGILLYRGDINKIITDGCESTTGFFNDIDEIYEGGSNLMCTEECPCHGTTGEVTAPYGALTLLECPGAT